jgi:choline dehydrogenase-like flavoprotein
MLAPPAAPSPPATQPAQRWWKSPVTQLRIAMFAFVASFLLESAMYLVEVFAGTYQARGFVVNSFAKDMTFAALGVVAVADLRRRMRLVGFLIFGHAVIVLTLFAAWISGHGDSEFFPPHWARELFDVPDSFQPGLGGWLPVAAGFTAVMIVLYLRAVRAAAGLKVLWPFEAETIAALAEVSLDDPKLTPQQIARNVDARWAAFPADRKGFIRPAFWIVAFLPLLWGRAPLPWMDAERRKRLVKRRLVAERAKLGPLRMTVQSALRFVTQMIYLGYYNDPKSYPPTHYERFESRARGKREIARRSRRRGVELGSAAADPRLKTMDPPAGRDASLRADYVVVGSGAGGAIAAAQLVERGKHVLLLDRGAYVPPSAVTEEEAEMYARLYSDGALQLSTDFTFQVLQGMCVGGGTVVNNGICFGLPGAILDEWDDTYAVGLNRRELAASFDAVSRLVHVKQLNGVHFSAGVHTTTAPRNGNGNGHGYGAGRTWLPFETNMRDCLGCGNCNLGCHYGSKLSMIQEVLPDAQGCGKGHLDILPLCRVDRIEMNGPRAARLRCRLRTEKPRDVTIHADQAIVVAAGAIHSSRLLIDSGVGGPLVGRNLGANLATFMTGVFDQPQNSFDGLQMTHYVPPASADDHILETFFNPVMSQALIMPGWLDEHQRNMERYDKLMCIGALVRSHPDERNRVRPRPHPITGAEFDFRVTDADRRRLVAGLKAAGEELLDRDACEVLPATYDYRSFTRKDELAKLDDVDVTDLGARTAHPQGGNGMSADPAKGVVGSDFKVHGTENLYVADASVFPSAIGVNPQMTVMALAHLAGKYIE